MLFGLRRRSKKFFLLLPTKLYVTLNAKPKGGLLMKSLIVLLILCPVLVQAKVVVHYTYTRAKKPVKKSISFNELKHAYEITTASTFNAPPKEVFFKDYLRFKMGTEVALNNPKLVTNPKIDDQITNPYLKLAFQQELYKALAEARLKKQNQALDKRVANMPASTLKKLYSKNPEFNIFFIAINHSIAPNTTQIQEAQTRANKVYKSVSKSKKPFLELVALYSDDKANGVLGINRSRGEIPPSAYNQIKRMREGSISKPIRIPTGYMIVKLNKKVPFSEANQTLIKANYFNEQRSTIFNQYFDSLKKHFKVVFVNKGLIQSL